MPTWTPADIAANAEFFRSKLRAEMQRHAVLSAVEAGTMDFVLLDTRTRAQFDNGHIPGAWCAPLDELPKLVPVLPRERLIVTYCNGFD
jgi:rhodanese-related sulfurtransferase